MNKENPSMDELLQKVDSKFSLVTVIAKRARMLNNSLLSITGESKLQNKKIIPHIMKEIIDGKIKAYYPEN